MLFKGIIASILSYLILTGCTTREAYEKPIEEYMKNNLNDASSYEPIEFKVFNSLYEMIQNIPDTYSSFIDFQNSLSRSIKSADEIFSIIDPKDSNMFNILKNNFILLRKFSNNTEICNYANLDDLLSNAYNSSNRLMTAKLEKRILERIVRVQGNLKRAMSEYKNLKNSLKRISPSKSMLCKAINNRQLIFHKYRAKNQFGALILSSRVFYLDNINYSVYKSLEAK
ncbi:hypothetical protein [Fulvivirga sp.]|uniref:hypothetical protein n=1 Tax=Fulvivirga sp. TaxID=1931237 RepID=UPI0032EFEDCC